MTHNEIARVCRQEVVGALGLESEYDIPIIPWDRVIYDFAAACHDMSVHRVIGVGEIKNAFRVWLDRTVADQVL